MTEVTAEMIERGRGTDPKVATERRRLAAKVREAREKLTSAGSGHRAFDVELLQLYAKARKGSTLAFMLYGLVAALVALAWATPGRLIAWVGLDLVTTAVLYWLAKKFLSLEPGRVNVGNWRGNFVIAEVIQGIVWAQLVTLIGDTADPNARTFVLVMLLLVAAMNATITASIPVAVYAGLAPMTAAAVAFLWPASLDDRAIPLAVLACSTLLYSAVLAKKLYARSIELSLLRGGKGRIDRRTRTGKDQQRRGAPACRGSQSGEVTLPRNDEPRVAYAAQRHSRLLRSHAGGVVRRPQSAFLQRIFKGHPLERPALADADQRDSRPVARRSRPLRIEGRARRAQCRHGRVSPSDRLAGEEARHHDHRIFGSRIAAHLGGSARRPSGRDQPSVERREIYTPRWNGLDQSRAGPQPAASISR